MVSVQERSLEIMGGMGGLSSVPPEVHNELLCFGGV